MSALLAVFYASEACIAMMSSYAAKLIEENEDEIVRPSTIVSAYNLFVMAE
jgi:hypothetical protein